MALTEADVEMWAALQGEIPPASRVLEIGQANWYGDAPPPAGCEHPDPFEVARRFYAKVLRYASIDAIDLDGPAAQRLNLNQPLALKNGYDIVINTGTTEHIFDQRRVFQTIHEACIVGGLMVHAVPTRNWPDHGFYCYQPCFFKDLCSANGYQEVYWAERKSLLYVALRKLQNWPFAVPIQGRYR